MTSNGTAGTSMMFTSSIRAQLTPGYQMPKIRGDQLDVLEKNFKQNRNPNDFELALISAEAGMSENDVKVFLFK
jgi:hypothetical protein